MEHRRTGSYSIQCAVLSYRAPQKLELFENAPLRRACGVKVGGNASTIPVAGSVAISRAFPFPFCETQKCDGDSSYVSLWESWLAAWVDAAAWGSGARAVIAEGYGRMGVVDGGKNGDGRVAHEPSPRPPPDIGKGNRVRNVIV